MLSPVIVKKARNIYKIIIFIENTFQSYKHYQAHYLNSLAQN
ncbi:hypothetical protein ESA_pESA3p05502 (plasmid) [Cronobacter sakazakii ATCC BAA-894]|uniref:Uncharacterized protein n=2 Tax=Cronobacter sakazakii TaxID=28141 RepID=A7MRE4_CROS8|nr:hypothetical protein ESA_pESA3p05502 [Cronobacter sakazakii ATCC BAA-894]QTD29930.1 hypothetical protein [Cronobacter sakazakii]